MFYVDGTFRLAPKFFHLLFALHVLNNDRYVPLAFLLLANKNQITYENIFRHTVSEATKLGVNIFPTNV